jgi:hypothetical protein
MDGLGREVIDKGRLDNTISGFDKLYSQAGD